jgi:hypothetical protein
VSTHWPLQRVVGQLLLQAPSTQNCPLGQTLPQPPQLFESCWMSTHWPEHSLKPPLQVIPQTELSHFALPFTGTSQLVPQLPQ